MKSHGCYLSAALLFPLLFLLPQALAAQNGSAAPSDQPAAAAPAAASSAAAEAKKLDSNAPEMNRKEGNPAVFRVKVNLVTIPVVVRDTKGHAIGGLTAADFQVYDHGKLQIIKQFEQVTPASLQEKARVAVEAAKKNSDAEAAAGADIPTRFIAYVLDDLQMKFGDFSQVRAAVMRHIGKNLRPGDRVALYTTSGRQMVEFTADSKALLAELDKVVARGAESGFLTDCPKLSYYLAWRIDQASYQGPEYDYAMAGTKACLPQMTAEGPSNVPSTSGTNETCSSSGLSNANSTNTCMDPNATKNRDQVIMSTGLALSQGDHQVHDTLDLIHKVVRRLSYLPGERLAVLISPGFFVREESMLSPIVEDATHNHVVLNTLDARGLYTSLQSGDSSMPITDGYTPELLRLAQQYMGVEQSMQNAILSDLAGSTGGSFAHDNDFDGALARTAEAPEFSYVLAFSPQNLKHDGAFHKIKVVLNGHRNVILQARRGYNAPLPDGDLEQQTQAAVREAMFSQEEVKEIPVEVQWQYFKTEDFKAKVNVLVHVDLSALPLRRDNDRNVDNLAIYVALFDRNGNYVTGRGQTLEMKLRDQTLNGTLKDGIVDKIALDVQSGNYLLRAVVRDSEGELVSAVSRAVQIP